MNSINQIWAIAFEFIVCLGISLKFSSTNFPFFVFSSFYFSCFILRHTMRYFPIRSLFLYLLFFSLCWNFSIFLLFCGKSLVNNCTSSRKKKSFHLLVCPFFCNFPIIHRPEQIMASFCFGLLIVNWDFGILVVGGYLALSFFLFVCSFVRTTVVYWVLYAVCNNWSSNR